MFLSNEQVGLYIRMLCAQHQHGGRIDTNELRTQCERIANGYAVFEKFSHDDGGSFNIRLEEEMLKRKKKGLKASESANMRWNKDPMRSQCERNANAMRSENENENIDNKLIKVTNGKKFEYNEIGNLPANYIEAAQRQLYTLQKKKMPQEQLLEMWETFKLEKITGDKFYSSEKDVYLHFMNWIKLQKFNEKPTQDDRAAQRAAYADKIAAARKKYL